MNRRIKIIIICIFMVIIGLKFIDNNFIKVQNVFDQMYYTRVKEKGTIFTITNSRGLFKNMKQLDEVGDKVERVNISDGLFNETYNADYLEENQKIGITFFRDDKKVRFYVNYKFGKDENISYEDNIILSYSYDVTTKTLTKNNVELLSYKTKKLSLGTDNNDDIEEFLQRRNLTWEELDKMQEQSLYDKFLKDWFEANKWWTRFSRGNLGKMNTASEKDENFKNVIE